MSNPIGYIMRISMKIRKTKENEKEGVELISLFKQSEIDNSKKRKGNHGNN